MQWGDINYFARILGKTSKTGGRQGALRGPCLPNQYDSVTITVDDSVDVYAIASSASSDVAILELS